MRANVVRRASRASTLLSKSESSSKLRLFAYIFQVFPRVIKPLFFRELHIISVSTELFILKTKHILNMKYMGV